ncbi:MULTISPECIES: tRNA (N6-isopentenyl adenosine(37)-C2)-methylthiotransferase MiaB [Segatella]|jgi:tRNA-2-methylthio-N6-dimethylallyladenosine synthase|uniref:tRNA-2-methylthio-N(6)-dimethylallyladenosine synthase n=3 Tax=Segatella TaxID=2974251 RepID=A0AA37HXB0_SEGBR|nr:MULTISPECIES: tRNA (N6-isopentenyl adenosine(37)-C2)-methylthiotransferase MiaB [Segatella]MEE3413963.1 tRNA (N6-isopentenyl adenosine(37)-C2)-methylthiotransferase MiaB [Prevotella sp.]MDR4930364.1 tRNA (N6-isopentenyl adenosine(37)-C2)-methylthiotransferase MiaB [Segatella bryantii]OYP55738.1 tRNA (N6-isopentenyl adenosine(37)-C2)-methylthiotransferase MiaB [Segatella bryantii]UKK76313.1 tRNA (N6-isopentenyl adenosine(37)-C2)-methylthiotransferase MiaB [Segatella bryantii]UKK77911.1 tRNA 
MDKKLFIETYGCQMNVADSEVVASVMKMAGYETTDNEDEADAIFLNTCSVRENAENKIFNRLETLHAEQKKGRKVILGVLGCMAERVKEDLVQNHYANLVCGPDSYLNLPEMIASCELGQPAIDVELSKTETYRDVIPQRIGGNHVSGFVSIMRGCNNFCHYCIVPFTRGRERSRDVESILREVKDLHDKGFKEVTLLGQNVNSYGLLPNGKRPENGTSFAELLRKVAESVPDMRVRFTTSNPEDMTEDILQAIADEPNLCHHIHFPAQSGSDKVLKLMNRKYTREKYMKTIDAIHRIIPDCGITTDVFVGYHDETEEDFQQTLSLMKEVGFDSAFMFKYSERPGTYAAEHLPDNISEEEKIRRLNELISLQTQISAEQNKKDEGKVFEILIERFGKRDRNQLMGRTPQNKAVIMAKGNHHIGEFVKVKITGSTSATLFGEEVK